MPNKSQITDRLKDTGSGLFYTLNNVNRELILSLNMGRIFYVNATDGDDATGARGRFDKPFKTINAAIAATADYVSGDIVEVMTGTYNENVLGKASVAIHLVLRGATVNGNIFINNNTNAGNLYLLQGSVVNGNILGTFGSATFSDGSGVINGTIGSLGDNGGHYVKGLRKLNGGANSAAMTYQNVILEDIGEIISASDMTFRFQNNVQASANNRNPIIRRIGAIRNTSANATAVVFQPNENVTIDTLEDIGLIECVNGKIYNDLFRGLHLYTCKNVTFKSKLESFFCNRPVLNCYDTRFICTDERIFRQYEQAPGTSYAAIKFYNCHFQAGGAATEIFATHDTYGVPYGEMYNCLYNKATLWNYAPPITFNTANNTYINGFTIQTPKQL